MRILFHWCHTCCLKSSLVGKSYVLLVSYNPGTFLLPMFLNFKVQYYHWGKKNRKERANFEQFCFSDRGWEILGGWGILFAALSTLIRQISSIVFQPYNLLTSKCFLITCTQENRLVLTIFVTLHLYSIASSTTRPNFYVLYVFNFVLHMLFTRSSLYITWFIEK